MTFCRFVMSPMNYTCSGIILLLVLQRIMLISALQFVHLRSEEWQNITQTLGYIDQVDMLLSGSVQSGRDQGAEECYRQFRKELWNCPRQLFSESLYQNVQLTKEMAFIQAITSAGITDMIVRNCSRGEVPGCECEPRARGVDWKWGGCSHNVVFGEQISKRYLGLAQEKEKLPRSIGKEQNYRAGRIAIRRNMKELCKCHGVSGSCTTQTCWKQVSNFRKVGKYLKKQYRAAIRVDYSEGHLHKYQNILSNRIEMKPRRKRRKPRKKIKKKQLVYMDPSPDYCTSSPVTGVKSAVGRKCLTNPHRPKEKNGHRKCTGLCRKCGLYSQEKERIVLISCNCRFEWCCNVKCEVCHSQQTEVTCSRRPTYSYMYQLQRHVPSHSYLYHL